MLIRDEREMQALGANFAEICSSPLTIYLSGPLGGGKTTFTRGFLQGLGHQGSVKSPTYTLVEPYYLNAMQIYHFDLYRVHDAEELELIGIRDYFNDDSVRLVEWPEQGEGKLPKSDITLSFIIQNEERLVEYSANTPRGKSVLNKFLKSHV